MLWEEREIHSDEYDEKVRLCSSSVESEASEQGEPVVEACKDSKHSSYTKYIMEVGNNVICVV